MNHIRFSSHQTPLGAPRYHDGAHDEIFNGDLICSSYRSLSAARLRPRYGIAFNSYLLNGSTD